MAFTEVKKTEIVETKFKNVCKKGKVKTKKGKC